MTKLSKVTFLIGEAAVGRAGSLWGHLTERKKLYDFLFTPFLKLLRPVKIARYLALKQFLAVSETLVCETGL